MATDTSGAVCSVALNDGETTLYECVARAAKSHARLLTELVRQCLSFADISAREVDVYAAAVGPGSYTGLRIGVATVKGMAHALGKPAVGVGTMDAIGLTYGAFFPGQELYFALDSRPGEVYGAVFDGQTRGLAPYKTTELEAAIQGRVVVTDAPQKLPANARRVLHTLPLAPAVAGLAARGQVLPPVPVYLKPVFKTTPKNAGAIHGKQPLD